MAHPLTATSLPRTIDPYDIERFTIEITRDDGVTPIDPANPPLLDHGEDIASYTVTVTAEGGAAGLGIKEGGGYAITLLDDIVELYFEVAADMQSDPMFDGAGVSLPVELSLTTTATPPRKKQKTVLVKVAQQ